jgi:environmental stress-induced protein Ves
VKFPLLHIVRQSSFKVTPWKNGGGITHEAIRVPASGDPFRWRVSVAHIDVSGPFSDFAAYQRKMVLLRGAGIELRFGDGRQATLRRVGELVEFDGAVATYCELLDGPCVDLNLMVSKADRAQVRVVQLDEAVSVRAAGGGSAGVAHDESTLIFSIDGAVMLESDTGEAVTLEPWDLAVLSQCGARLTGLMARDPPVATSVFIATLAPGGEGADRAPSR